MTLVIRYMGADLKSHECRVSDYKAAETLSHNWGAMCGWVLEELVKMTDKVNVVPEVNDVFYEDD